MQKKETPEIIRIAPEMMKARFYGILLRHGFTEERASSCAEIFTGNSLDGVYTHGVNRFPRFVKYIQEGHIDVAGEPVRRSASGCMEQWDGQGGPGPLNAMQCTDRAMEIADQQGMGCVALANTNHWMRGGTYGWRAARKGYAFMGWTNTTANMPTWGALDSKLGNNPLVLAVPYQQEAIVLDMAMSQFSYGALELNQMKDQQLPVPGGFTSDGKLTTDPGEILRSQRILPVGYWKGAGLSLLLDILATILSGGLPVQAISKQKAERSVSQVFLAVALSKLTNYHTMASTVQAIIDDYHQSVSAQSAKVVYPGERVLRLRMENGKKGIPVLNTIWDQIQAL